MPARSTIFLPGSYYHVFNRGSEKRTIFQSPKDYSKFLSKIKENSVKYGIELLCYCLMPNHFHFLLKQTTDLSIAQFMNPLQLGYAKFFNTKYERVGPLFQGRFKAKLIDSEEYLLHLSAYIHRNPGLSNLHTFPYSSYLEYCSPKDSSLLKTEYILSFFSKTNPTLSYRSFVEQFEMNDEIIASTFLYEN